MEKTIRKRFDLSVNTTGERVKEDFQLEKTIGKIKGLTITSDLDSMLYYRGSQQIEIGGREIFPEGYESKLLLTGVSLRPDQRYFPVDVEAGNGIISVSYQDTDHPSAPFVPYRVSLYIEAEQ